jgi:hypothetical protein
VQSYKNMNNIIAILTISYMSIACGAGSSIKKAENSSYMYADVSQISSNENNDIKDQDRDGIIDTSDACINEPGAANNRGCPNFQDSPKEEFSSGLSTPLLIGGGVLFLTGGVLLGVGINKQHTAEDNLANQSDSMININKNLELSNQLKSFGYIGLGIGAAALITGLILMDDDKSALRLVPGPGDIGVGVGLSF